VRDYPVTHEELAERARRACDAFQREFLEIERAASLIGVDVSERGISSYHAERAKRWRPIVSLAATKRIEA
jgi:hypothetical protein